MREVSEATAKRRAQQLVDELLAPGGKFVLDAGCGSLSHLRLDAAEHRVGIDISPLQLERNTGLDERIVGDIETYQFSPDSFDLLIAWFVLEHLERPAEALDNLVAAARPGALIVVGVPNIQSIKGIVAKLTPAWAHVAVVRRVYPYWSREDEDIGPFPTKLRRSISAGRLRKYAEQRGLRVCELVTYESQFQGLVRRACHIEGRSWDRLRRAVAVVTGRRVSASGSDLLVAFQLPSRAGQVPNAVSPWTPGQVSGDPPEPGLNI
jgi:SAM-dependent methyltransferase